MVHVAVTCRAALALGSLPAPASSLPHTGGLAIPTTETSNFACRLCRDSLLSRVRTVRAESPGPLTKPVTFRAQSPAVAGLTENLAVVLVAESAVQPLVTDTCMSEWMMVVLREG